MFIYLLLFFFAEIGKVRGNLFQINGKKQEPLSLPEAAGAPVTLSEKVYVPIKEYPDVSISLYVEYCLTEVIFKSIQPHEL